MAIHVKSAEQAPMLGPMQRKKFWDSRQRWDAYVRQIRNGSAARLLDQVRRQFPGDLLPGDPVFFSSARPMRSSEHVIMERPLLADIIEKVFSGWRTRFSRASDAFRAQRCEGPRRISENDQNLRIGAMAHPNGGVVPKSEFARFLASFDFRLSTVSAQSGRPHDVRSGMKALPPSVLPESAFAGRPENIRSHWAFPVLTQPV
jgi:hypothetical protein